MPKATKKRKAPKRFCEGCASFEMVIGTHRTPGPFCAHWAAPVGQKDKGCKRWSKAS